MNWFNITLILLCCSFNLLGQTGIAIVPGSYTLEIDNESFVRIKGRTNVSTFECAYNSELSSKLFQVGAKKGVDGATCFDDAVIQLSTGSFDCGLREMTKDFQQLLEEKEHPYMTMDVQCMASDLIGGNLIHESEVKLTIAGVSNFYKIPFKTRRDEATIYCSGSKKIAIEDFNIVPPTKLFGLIKVHDVIKIEFHIVIKFDKSASAINTLSKIVGE